MSTNFPAAKDNSTSLPVEASTTPLATNHVVSHQNLSDAVVALETKVGIDSSADTTTLDYKLKSTSQVNPGHKHTLNATGMSDVIITTPSDGEVLTYIGGTWVNQGTSAADASTTVKGVTKLSVAPVTPTNPIAVGDNDTRMPSQGENDALVGTSGTPSTSNKYVTNDDTASTSTASKVVRANGSGKIDSTFLSTTAEIQTFTTPGSNSWTMTSGAKKVFVQLWAGGGSGGTGSGTTEGGGGGGGSYSESWFDASALSSPITVTIGAGGASVSADNTDGNVGSNSTFGALLTTYGGGGGASGATKTGGGGGGGGFSSVGLVGGASAGGNGGGPFEGAGGTNTVGAASIYGGGGGGEGLGGGSGTATGGASIWGGGGGGGGDASGAVGGASFYGGGGGGGGDATPQAGGTSMRGGNGGAGAGTTANATAGSTPSGGGGGCLTGNSGAGGGGKCTVTTFF